MADQFIYLMTDTWNNGATDFAGIQMNVTDSASLSTSRLLDLQIGGNSKFKVQKDGSVTLTSSDAGATAGPMLALYRNSASPAASDIIGEIAFQGEDSAGNTETYGLIDVRIDDPTSASEDSRMMIWLENAGVLQNTLQVLGLGTMILTNFDAVGTAGPIFDMHRDSASPAASDVIGQIQFNGEDSTSVKTLFADIVGIINDPVNGTEDGELLIRAMTAGTITTRITVNTGVQINGATSVTGTFLSTGDITASGSNMIAINFVTPAGIFARTAGTIAWRPNGGADGTTSTNQATYDTSGNFVAAGNVTAFSDDRLKDDWASLDQSFLDLLADIKCGTYTRKDLKSRHVGVSAQDLQRVLPQAVHENEDGVLSVAYGNAALVAAVEMANEVRSLRYRVAELEAN